MNGEYEGDDPIGDLMHDFACANPDEMRSKLLAEKTRYYKQDDKGVRRMSKIMEEFAIEERTEAKLEDAQNMLMENLPVETVVRCTGLPLETVQQLAEELKAPVEQ